MNCKPGDLAIIVRPHTSDRNLGAIVEVLRFHDAGRWWVRPLCAGGLFLDGKRIPGGAPCSDSRLRPIRPGEITNTESRPETVAA